MAREECAVRVAWRVVRRAVTTAGLALLDERAARRMSRRSTVAAVLIVCAAVGWGAGDAGAQHRFLERDGAAAPPSIQALVERGDGTLYAGSFGFGIFASDDRGETWTAVNDGLSDRFVLCLSADDRTVYAGTVRGGVFRLTADGDAWESMTAGLRRVEVKTLLTRDGIMYAGTGAGVYQWDADARRWGVVAAGLEQTLVPSVAVADDARVFAGTAGQGVYRLDTTVDGARWERTGDALVDPGERLTHTYVRVMAVGPNGHVYAGTLDGGLYRSRDAGRTWRTFGRSLPNDSIRGIVFTETSLYVATGRGVFKRVLRGSHDVRWTPANTGLTALSVQALIGASSNELYAGTSAGMFRSRDGGDQWVDISDDLGRYGAMPRPY